MKDSKLKFNSKLIHAGSFADQFGSATVPIYQTSTFTFDSVEEGSNCFAGESNGFIYTRINNPTIKALEDLVAELENGYGGIATSSGMAAVNTIYMALLNPGDHIISTDAIYGPSRSLMENHYSKYGIESTYINSSSIDNIIKALKPNTKLLYIETPANPTLEITDLAACSEIAKLHNLILVVDNTFCSPFLQKPLDFGADIVFHSMTKFINGHADIVAGMIVTKRKELFEKLRSMMVISGCNMDPHQAYMVLRGVKTLSLRIERAQENALKVAQFLENNEKVSWVKFPGLDSHPQHKLSENQMNGYGAIISFGLKGGFEPARVLLNNVRLASLAVSLGGVETLIQHPASMTHSKVSKEGKIKAGITDDLIRLSVGIEDVDDILADLSSAIDKIEFYNHG